MGKKRYDIDRDLAQFIDVLAKLRARDEAKYLALRAEILRAYKNL